MEEATVDVFSLLPTKEVKCLADGFVRLVECMPRFVPVGRTMEFSVIQSARISTGLGLKDKLTDDNLLRYLYRKYHTSPFESVKFTFHIKCPKLVSNQLIRHRTANINEKSQRYSVVDEPLYYSPLDEDGAGLRVQSKTNKQSSELDANRRDAFVEECVKADEHVEAIFDIYYKLIEMGMARETARAYLPVGTYTELYFTMDLHNLMKFLRLRMDSHAQAETRVFARAMHDLIKPLVPLALECFRCYTLESITLSAHEIAAIRNRKKELEGVTSKSEQLEYQEKLQLLGLTFD